MISVSIIGCGAYGREHASCLSRLPGVAIRGLCDIGTDTARRMKEDFRGIFATTDAEEIFRDARTDAVFICTHHDTHAALGVRAAECGKHIMMEKPLALPMDECRAVREAVERHRVRCMMGFKFRFYPAVERAREFLTRPVLTIAHGLDTRWPDAFWANDPTKGGGNVLSEGCHVMDLVAHLNRTEPERVYAGGGNYTHPGLPIVDNIGATITFAHGGVALVAVGDSGFLPRESKFSIQMTDGVRSVQLHDRLKSAVLFDGEIAEEQNDTEELGILEGDRRFIHALRTKTETPTTVTDGVRATAMILAAFESIRTGQAQEVGK